MNFSVGFCDTLDLTKAGFLNTYFQNFNIPLLNHLERPCALCIHTMAFPNRTFQSTYWYLHGCQGHRPLHTMGPLHMISAAQGRPLPSQSSELCSSSRSQPGISFPATPPWQFLIGCDSSNVPLLVTTDHMYYFIVCELFVFDHWHTHREITV